MSSVATSTGQAPRLPRTTGAKPTGKIAHTASATTVVSATTEEGTLGDSNLAETLAGRAR